MRNKTTALGTAALILILGGSALPSLAQQPAERVFIRREASAQGPERTPGPEGKRIERDIMIERSPTPAPGDFIFLATEMGFGGKLVKGAPYSAQAVTESTQTLGDGNRIVHKSTATLYRDSEGRTRREQTLRAIGYLASGGEPTETIFISDPVAGTSYTLDVKAQVARKMPPLRFKVSSPPGQVEQLKQELSSQPQYRIRRTPGSAETPQPGEKFEVAIQPDVLMDKRAVESGVAIGWLDKRNPGGRTESLGKQTINGVEAEGSRTTVTIPAGEIGNERPIEIVSERWYSPELQVMVMTRHSDPRFGENSYQLTNINRTEPERSLFEVPAGYTVKEAPQPTPAPMQMRKRRSPEHLE